MRKALLALLVVALAVEAHGFCSGSWDKEKCNTQTRTLFGRDPQRICAYCEGGSALSDEERCMDMNTAIAIQEGNADREKLGAGDEGNFCKFEGISSEMRLASPEYCWQKSYEECPTHDDNGAECVKCPISKKCESRRLMRENTREEQDGCMEGFCDKHGPCEEKKELAKVDYCHSRSAEECEKGPAYDGGECALCGNGKCVGLNTRSSGLFGSLENLSSCPLAAAKFCSADNMDPRCPCGAGGRGDSISSCLNDKESGGGFANVEGDKRARCNYCARIVKGEEVRECRSQAWVDAFTRAKGEGFDTMACVQNIGEYETFSGTMKRKGLKLTPGDRPMARSITTASDDVIALDGASGHALDNVLETFKNKVVESKTVTCGQVTAFINDYVRHASNTFLAEEERAHWDSIVDGCDETNVISRTVSALVKTECKE